MSEHIKIYGFWDRVDLVVSECGMSKSELMRRAGVSRGLLYDRVGDRMFSMGTLAKFCAATNTSADWLLGLSKERYL